MLNRAFADPGVEAVVDVSGGDLANEVLSYLDWGTIAANPKPVVGYSDLTCVLNAIVARTGRTAVLWNAMAGLHRGFGVLDAALAGETIRPALAGADGDADAFEALPWLGGNLTRFLKLAGARCRPGARFARAPSDPRQPVSGQPPDIDRHARGRCIEGGHSADADQVGQQPLGLGQRVGVHQGAPLSKRR